MTIYDEMRLKIKDLREGAELQKKNSFNRKEHHLAMTDGLSAVLCQDAAETQKGELKAERDALERRRAAAIALVTQVITHLEQGFLDGSSGQALQLARFARSQLEPT